MHRARSQTKEFLSLWSLGSSPGHMEMFWSPKHGTSLKRGKGGKKLFSQISMKVSSLTKSLAIGWFNSQSPSPLPGSLKQGLKFQPLIVTVGG